MAFVSVDRRLLTSYCDGFTFEDALGLARQYSSAITPAAAHYYLDNYANIHVSNMMTRNAYAYGLIFR